MNSWGAFGRLWRKLFGDCGESGGRVFDEDAEGSGSDEGGCFGGGDEDDRGFRVPKLFDVTWVGKEGKIASDGFVEGGEAVDEHFFAGCGFRGLNWDGATSGDLEELGEGKREGIHAG